MSATGLSGLLSSPGSQLALSAAIVFGVQRLVPTMDPSWYKALKKPKWTPPNYVFPLMWIPLKCMQSLALMLAWRAGVASGKTGSLVAGLAAFGTHLALGNYWNVVFMGRHQMKESLPVMGAFWLSIAGTAATFSPLSRTAGALMLPTLAWVSVAWKLNADIVALNT